MGASRAPDSSLNDRTQGQEGKVVKNPKTTIHQHKSPGRLHQTLTTSATAGGPIHTSLPAALQRDRDTNVGIQCRVAARFILHTPLLLTSSQIPPLPVPGSSRLLVTLQNTVRGLSLDFTSSFSSHNGGLHPIPVPDLHSTNPWALCPQRCHDLRLGCGFNHM